MIEVTDSEPSLYPVAPSDILKACGVSRLERYERLLMIEIGFLLTVPINPARLMPAADRLR